MSDSQNSNLLPTDKELLGTLYAYKKAVPGFDFDYLVGDPQRGKKEDPTKLIYFGMIFPEQKKTASKVW